MTIKNQTYEWSTEAETAFHALKEALCRYGNCAWLTATRAEVHRRHRHQQRGDL